MHESLSSATLICFGFMHPIKSGPRKSGARKSGPRKSGARQARYLQQSEAAIFLRPNLLATCLPSPPLWTCFSLLLKNMRPIMICRWDFRSFMRLNLPESCIYCVSFHIISLLLPAALSAGLVHQRPPVIRARFTPAHPCHPSFPKPHRQRSTEQSAATPTWHCPTLVKCDQSACPAHNVGWPGTRAATN